MRMNRLLILALLSCVVLAAPSAAASFNFDYSLPAGFPGGSAVTAQGTLTTLDLDLITNTYLIVDITGTRAVNGVPETITGLIAPNGFGNNNLLYATDPLLDFYGMAFTVAGAGNDGLGNVNIYHLTGGYTENQIDVGNGTFSVTANQPSPAVPEPGTMVLLGAGLSAVFLAARRRRSA